MTAAPRTFFRGFSFVLMVIAAAAPGAQEMVVGNEVGVGARAMGMGGAYTAVADDISAVFYNPAGLAQIRRIEWNLGIGFLRAGETSELRSAKSAPAVGRDSGEATVTSISSFGGVFPVPTYRGSLVFAASYHRVKEFDLEFRVSGYSDALDGALSGRSVDSGGLDMWSFAGAVDVSPAVSLGASFDYYRGDHTLEEKRSYSDPVSRWNELFHSGYSDRIRAWNLHAGMLFRAFRTIRLGVGLRLPIRYSVKSGVYDDWYARSGDPFTLDEHPSAAFSDTTDLFRGNFSYSVKSPVQVDAGASLTFKGLTLSGDVTWLDWSQATTDLREPEYRYRPTVNWRVGAETAVSFLNMFLRAGYASAPDPYKGYIYRRSTVAIREINRRDFITAGAGFLLDQNMMLDLALFRGFWSAEESPRTDESTRTKLLAIFSYRM